LVFGGLLARLLHWRFLSRTHPDPSIGSRGTATSISTRPGTTPLTTRGDLREHFHDARVEFYSAEGLRTFSRDTLPQGEFEKLQDEVHSGIKDDVRGAHADGYQRVLAVVRTARALQLTSNPLTTRIHTRDRGGICHQLANDGKVRWVK
jgi:hypothetical protein